MPGIFISYRRDDSAYIAAAINEKFQQRFGEDHVFFDIDTIPLGVDFRDHIGGAVGGCDALLVVIGDQWVDAKDKTGQQRLHQPTDYVRVEIESALQRNVPVVPVLVGNAMMPTGADLPESIRDLAFRNAAEVRAGRDLGEHLERLVRDVGKVAGISPSHPHMQQPATGTASPPANITAPNAHAANAPAATIPAGQSKSRAPLMVAGLLILIGVGVAIAFATGLIGPSGDSTDVASNDKVITKNREPTKDSSNVQPAAKDTAPSKSDVNESAVKDVGGKDESVKDAPVKDSPTKIVPTKVTPTKTEPTNDSSGKDASAKDSSAKDASTKDADAKDSAGKDTPPRDPKVLDRSDAKATAIAILTGFKTKEFVTLSTLVHEDKRKEFAELAALTEEHPRYANVLSGWRSEAIKTWTGKVESPRYEKRASGAGRIKAIVRFEQKSLTPLVVVSMYLNDGQWEFEDLESPPEVVYKRMSTEQPK